MLTEALLLLLLVVIIVNLTRGRSTKRLPPGPRIYPVVGSVLVKTLDDARKLCKEYGDIFRYKAGQSEMVCLCTYKLIKEAFTKTSIVDRPHWQTFHWLTEGRETGIILSNGQRWQNARRFLMRNLRDLGMGKSRLDSAIQNEAQELVESFRRIEGKAAPFPQSLYISILNIIWQLVASRRYNLDDQDIHDFIALIRAAQRDTAVFMLPDIFPILKYLPHALKRRYLAQDTVDKLAKGTKTFLRNIVDSHKEDLDPTSPRDIIDDYLIEMDKQTDLAFFFYEDDMLKMLMDLFIAGYDTTANSLIWLLLYLATHPEVQQKAQQEVDAAVPKGTLPSTIDKQKMPYLEATIEEALRVSSFAPFGLFHMATQETELGGYDIPEGTIVMGCAGLCHEDPQYWQDPTKFDPTRFLDSEGKFVSQREGFLPFGVGRRQCLGESLARMELFIFSAALLQNFSFAPPPGKSIDLTPDMIPLSQPPKTQDVLVTARK